MRSSAIAEESIARGIETIFIGEILDLPWVVDRINNLGFSKVYNQPSKFEPDANDVLIIDSYTISKSDPFLSKKYWSKIISIFDDSTPDYICDVRIHPGIKQDWDQKYAVRTFSGPEFIPLRKSILKSRKHVESDPLKIIITGGGPDNQNFAQGVAQRLNNTNILFHASILSDNLQKKSLDERFSFLPTGMALDDIADEADLVFTTAGTTSFEFIAREIPVAIGCSVQNQLMNYVYLKKRGLAAPIGIFQESKWFFNNKLIIEVIRSKKKREILREKNGNLVDLDGAKRILNIICG